MIDNFFRGHYIAAKMSEWQPDSRGGRAGKEIVQRIAAVALLALQVLGSLYHISVGAAKFSFAGSNYVTGRPSWATLDGSLENFRQSGRHVLNAITVALPALVVPERMFRSYRCFTVIIAKNFNENFITNYFEKCLETVGNPKDQQISLSAAIDIPLPGESSETSQKSNMPRYVRIDKRGEYKRWEKNELFAIAPHRDRSRWGNVLGDNSEGLVTINRIKQENRTPIALVLLSQDRIGPDLQKGKRLLIDNRGSQIEEIPLASYLIVD